MPSHDPQRDIQTPSPSHGWHLEDTAMVLDVTSRADMTLWAAAGAEENYAIKLWGPGAERIYGYSREEALGRNYIDLFVDEHERARAIEDHQHLVESNTSYTWDWSATDHAEDGSIKRMLTHCFRIEHPVTGQWLLAELGVDVSKLDRANQQLRKVREEDLQRQGVLFARAVGQIGQAVGKEGSTLEAVMSAISESVTHGVTRVYQTRIWLIDSEDRIEFSAGHKGDLPFYADAAVSVVMEQGEPIFCDSTTTEGPGPRLRIRGRRGRVRTFALFPLRTSDTSRKMGVLAVAWNSNPAIAETDRNRLETLAASAGDLLAVARELERSRAEARKRQLAETKQTIFRSVLHTVGNQVFSLQGQQENLEETTAHHHVPNEVANEILRMREHLTQLAESLRELREHIEAGEEKFELVSLREAIGAVVNILRVHYPTIDFSIRVPGDSAVHIPRGWLHHILQNVVMNAVQILIAVDDGGTIALTATPRGPGDMEINIEDTGPGVDESICTTLFDEGVTKRTGGTGQGLHIARDLAESSGGKIELVGISERLKGAHFRIMLPVKVP